MAVAKQLQKIRNEAQVLQKDFDSLEQTIKITESESPIEKKLKMTQVGLFPKAQKVIGGMKKIVECFPLLEDADLTKVLEYTRKLTLFLDPMSAILKNNQREVEWVKKETVQNPKQDAKVRDRAVGFYMKICPPIYSLAQGIYDVILLTLENVTKSEKLKGDLQTQFSNVLLQLFQKAKGFVTAVDMEGVEEELTQSAGANCHKAGVELATSICHGVMKLFGQTDEKVNKKQPLIGLLGEPLTAVSSLCDMVFLPLLPVSTRLPDYKTFFKAMHGAIRVTTVAIKQSRLEKTEYKESDRRTLLTQLEILVDDLVCCLPTINKFVDDCEIQLNCFFTLCPRIADWFRNVSSIEPTLCFENDITVSVPWKTAPLLSSCYIKRADDVSGNAKDEILSQIKLETEQNIVSDIYITEQNSKPFKLPTNEVAEIRFPGVVEDDPEKLIFAVFVKAEGKWKKVQAKFDDGILCFKDRHIEAFLAYSDFPVVVETVTPEDGYCFESVAQPGLTAEIPPGAVDKAEEYQFKVAPINMDRFQEYKEMADEPDDKKKSDLPEDDFSEATPAEAPKENSGLISLSDGLIVHSKTDKPLQKSAKVTFPLEGKKDETELFLVRIVDEDNIQVFFEDELAIVNSVNNACTVELKGFSINHMGRVKKLKKRKSKENIVNDALLILGKLSICMIEVHYTVTPSNVHFLSECSEKNKRKQMKRTKSKQNILKQNENWQRIPMYWQSADFHLKETASISIEVGGFFSLLPGVSKDSMNLTFIRNANNSRTFPVNFQRPKDRETEQQQGLLNFITEEGKCIHSVFFGKELLPPPPRKAVRKRIRRRPGSGDVLDDDDDVIDDNIPISDQSPQEIAVQKRINDNMEEGGSVISDKSIAVLASFLSLNDVKTLVLQMGLSWNKIDMVTQTYTGKHIGHASTQLLIEWRNQRSKRTDLPDLLIGGLRDTNHHVLADVVEEIYNMGGGLKPKSADTANHPKSDSGRKSSISEQDQ